MPHQPIPPAQTHVWVRATGDHGSPVPGVVVGWQHTPIHPVNTSDWLALVVTRPFDDGLLVSWVGAEKLIPVRDPSPTDAG